MQICHPITLATAAALLVGSAVAHAAEPLPALGVDITQTSVSGISSGAYMAGQFHLAFSTTVVGAGVVAGGPWGCASNGSGDSLLLGGLDNATRALAGCMQVTGGAPDGGALAEAAKAFAHKHRIDPLSGLEGDRVYLFHGESDSVVATPVTTTAEAFYRSAGITVADMHAVYQLPGGKAGHSLVVDRDGSACDANASPFIDDCDYDQAGEILRWIYPDLVGRPGPAAGRRIVFDQTEFLAGAVGWGIAREGVAYVPADCEAAPGAACTSCSTAVCRAGPPTASATCSSSAPGTCATRTPTGSCCFTRRPTPTRRRTRAGTGGGMRHRTTCRRARRSWPRCGRCSIGWRAAPCCNSAVAGLVCKRTLLAMKAAGSSQRIEPIDAAAIGLVGPAFPK